MAAQVDTGKDRYRWKGRDVTLAVIGAESGVGVAAGAVAGWWATQFSWWVVPLVSINVGLVVVVACAEATRRWWPR